MPNLSRIEVELINRGERLIPGRSHNLGEWVRHRNSYVFWQRVIAGDLSRRRSNSVVRILDIGCGVGHGCRILSETPGVEVVGIDNSADAVAYASEHYSGNHISYVTADAAAFVDDMMEFDYVVSRGVLEHIPNGIELARKSRWRRRLMFDVPYLEQPGNPHHVVHQIDETAFAGFDGRELFFQDLSGFWHPESGKPSDPPPNMVMCAVHASDLPDIASFQWRFPCRHWSPNLWAKARDRGSHLKFRIRSQLRRMRQP